MKLSQLFKKKNLLIRQVYAVESGFLIGNFITIIAFDDKTKIYSVLGTKLDENDPKALEIPEKDIKEGIEKGVLTYIDTLNCKFYKECRSEYLLLKSTK